MDEEIEVPAGDLKNDGEPPKVEQPKKFDFTEHSAEAVARYLPFHGFYRDLAYSAKRITEEALRKADIRVGSVEARAKDPVSFGKKASKPSESDPNKPRYPNPFVDITDLAAIRIITFFPRTIPAIDKVIKSEFIVLEHANKGEELLEEEKFGYQSVHYLVKISSARASLPEYEVFKDGIVEVQVRTVLQHAWAEIEHDIQYKSSVAIPRDIKRRFMALAGLLELADREFQAIQDADKELNALAAGNVARGELNEVEITPSSLKAYLDKRMGADYRISPFSYDWLTRLVKRFGFRTLQQLDEATRGYDDDAVSRIVDGYRQGQTTRFERVLLAAMGELFVTRHLWRNSPWFLRASEDGLEKLRAFGIPIGNFDPNRDEASGASEAPNEINPIGGYDLPHLPGGLPDET
jgi:putative GTP pyrophosphokinase